MHDPLELTATPRRVHDAAKGAQLSDRALARALDIVVATPSEVEWGRYLSRALALFGAGLVLAGVICFVAYNWSRVGRFGKFAVVELAIVATTLLAWRKFPRVSGQVALLASAVLVGPLLAIYGQTYQTGADPYSLFLTWFALIIPWTIAAGFAALWLLALAVADVALGLYWEQVLTTTTREDLWLCLMIACIHAVALVSWELQFHRAKPWLTETWAPRVVAASGFVALFIPATSVILNFGKSGAPGVVGLLGLGAAIAAACFYYRQERRDYFIVTAAVATGMVFAAVIVARFLFEGLKLEFGGLLLLSAFVVFEITLGLRWYRAGRDPALDQ
jgi:uncharacterized membrane protein